jgi:hypothetical protein
MLGKFNDAKYITVVDGTSYFYQLPVKPEDRHKFGVNSHRGQEIFDLLLSILRSLYVEKHSQVSTLGVPGRCAPRPVFIMYLFYQYPDKDRRGPPSTREGAVSR